MDKNEDAEKGTNQAEQSLRLAARQGDISVLQKLIPFVDIDARESSGDSALILAARNGYKAAVALLAVAGADVNARNRCEGSALECALHVDDFLLTQLLLVTGAAPNAARRDGVTPLMFAALQGAGRSIKALLAAGADVNAQIPAGRNAGFNALMFAALDSWDAFGRLQCAKLLIKHGINVNAVAGNGETALTLAAQHNAALMPCLINAGADASFRNSAGLTARAILQRSRTMRLNPMPSVIPAGITKGELAKIRIPEGVQFDCALPQDWLNQFSGEKYDLMACRCVMTYPPEYPCGVIVDLVTGRKFEGGIEPPSLDIARRQQFRRGIRI
jgi:uncharacterized protein